MRRSFEFYFLIVAYFAVQPASFLLQLQQLTSKQLRTQAASTAHKLDSKYVKTDLSFSNDKRIDLIFCNSSTEKLNSDDIAKVREELIEKLDYSHGVLLQSSYEYPNRYTRWTIGFAAPPLMITGFQYNFNISALNKRGNVLLEMIYQFYTKHGNSSVLIFNPIQSKDKLSNELSTISSTATLLNTITGYIVPNNNYVTEENRSKKPSLLTLMRFIKSMFGSEDTFTDSNLGFYGAFGYDLAFQFETIDFQTPRNSGKQKDLALYLPDEILVIDNAKNTAETKRFDFSFSGDKAISTIGISRHYYNYDTNMNKINENTINQRQKDMERNYTKWVEIAKEQFKVGNLFEVVLSQMFSVKDLPKSCKPSNVFRVLCAKNPSPYGFLINLGEKEFLIGASPEMFVRVENVVGKGLRVETCPISGTIERGNDAIEDAIQIQKLLSNRKEESELTMCTDVDRNDKSRICIPNSVKVIGRRQIELYSRLIHTVDHVEGYLREEFDAIDAFLCHMWAVTVTGAPKVWAMKFIESIENQPRHWYGGAVGCINFDGSLNTGLTLRAARINGDIAEVRTGATLLYDSDPQAEEKETRLKASAVLDAISVAAKMYADSDDNLSGANKVHLGKGPHKAESLTADRKLAQYEALKRSKKHVLLIDHEDSFVHTLANYFRQTGVSVTTCRSGPQLQEYLRSHSNIALAVLSPGPGHPKDFNLDATINLLLFRNIPIFGVCLGLQGIVEYFGGTLNVLDVPVHGKQSTVIQHYCNEGEEAVAAESKPIMNLRNNILQGLPRAFGVGRYHSLYANQETLPKILIPTASTQDDNVIMAIQHRIFNIAAVQFHPESILTMPTLGLQLVNNVVKLLAR